MLEMKQHQLIAFERAKRKHLLLADACGVGKTLPAIETVKALVAQLGKPALIVVPARIKDQWLDKLLEQGVKPECIFWLDSTTKDISHLADDMIILTHYEAMVKHLAWLKLSSYSVIVADEAHRIKNRKAKRSEAIKQVKSYRRIALTGTPYDRDPSDIWSILNWLDPQFFSSYWKFFEAHINYEERIISYRTGQRIKQIKPQPLKDAESFARVLRPYMLQRSKQDVRPDLPDNIIEYIDLEMYPDQSKAYKHLVDSEDPIVSIDGVDITVQIVLTQILREIQLTTDPMLLGLNTKSIKLDWVIDWVEDNPNESVIIFTRFASTAKKLKELLPQFELVIGGTKARKMVSADRRIIATIAAGAEGMDLPWVDTAIFLDVEWSSILMQQALDRIHRINIENVKHTYYLRCKGTVDYLLHTALQGKWNTKELAERFLKGKQTVDSL